MHCHLLNAIYICSNNTVILTGLELFHSGLIITDCMTGNDIKYRCDDLDKSILFFDEPLTSADHGIFLLRFSMIDGTLFETYATTKGAFLKSDRTCVYTIFYKSTSDVFGEEF